MLWPVGIVQQEGVRAGAELGVRVLTRMSPVRFSTENAEMTTAARAVWELVLTLGEGGGSGGAWHASGLRAQARRPGKRHAMSPG